MSRNYWGVVFAVAGLILVGAGNPPKQAEVSKQDNSKGQLQQAATTMPPPIVSIKIPAKRDPGCENGQDNRNSELCAEWKSVDAARDAARYSLWGLGAAFIGTIFLVLTFWETRRTARAQLRAYVAVDPKNLILKAGPEKIEADLTISNDGETPAFGACWAGNIVISTDAQMEADLDVTKPDPPSVGRPTKTAIHPGKDVTAGLKAGEAYTEEQLLSVVNGKAHLYIIGFVWYVDAFRKKRLTRFCFKAERLPAPGEEPHPIIGHRCWVTTPFHNDAT